MIASDEELPSKVKRVEYYREQKIFTFAFEDKDEEDRLMSFEVSDEVSELVKSSPDVIVLMLTSEGEETDKYLCPLVQIGI